MKDMFEAAKGDTEIVDVCMIRAGCAGLNALFVASQYLGKTDRVVVAARHDAPGGMWNGVYDYNRLHQPHPAITVGDIEWDWDKPQEYLARCFDEVPEGLRALSALPSSPSVIAEHGLPTHCPAILGHSKGF